VILVFSRSNDTDSAGRNQYPTLRSGGQLRFHRWWTFGL